MTDKDELSKRLGARLKHERSEKKLSLDALAKLSGVSRSMLSQIERGESSPTVASLWNLTRALNLDFSTLLDQPVSGVGPILELQRSAQTPIIRNTESGCEIRILSAPQEVGRAEMYDIRFQAGARFNSTPHEEGTVEHLTVLDGKLVVRSGDQVEKLGVGDTIRYRADLDHAIAAEKPARALLLVRKD